MASISKFKHDCVIHIDQWQNEDLGRIEVTDRSIEFISDENHLIIDLDSLQEIKIEQGIVRISSSKQGTYSFRLLQHLPYKKWYSTKTYYDDDKPSSRKFVSNVYSIMKSRKAEPKVKEKLVIKELVLIPCKYCGVLMPQTATFCPECGARKK